MTVLKNTAFSKNDLKAKKKIKTWILSYSKDVFFLLL